MRLFKFSYFVIPLVLLLVTSVLATDSMVSNEQNSPPVKDNKKPMGPPNLTFDYSSNTDKSITRQTPQEIAKKSFASVVLLVMEDANGQPVSLGSGFFVRSDIVATNLHVVEDASNGYAKIVGQEKKYDIAGLVGIDQERDLVLLSVTGTKAPSLPLGNSGDVAIGDEIYAIGNPQGLEGTFSQGIVSGIRKIESDTIFQITASISPGSSGGPVLNSQGKVIGVATAAFKEGQNLNFAIPVSYLLSLLQNIKKATPLSGKLLSVHEKSIFENLGDRSTEGMIGTQFLWDDDFDVLGFYSFSLRNKLREPVKNVYCLVIFFDSDDDPVDVDIVYCNEIVPAGLAKRVNSSVDVSVKKLTTTKDRFGRYSLTPSKIEFRILDFKIVE